MVSPKPESYHDALYHLATAAESSPSPQPGHYPDSHHYPPHHQAHYPHHDSVHHPVQGRHYGNMPPVHRQYSYEDPSYSPASGSIPSTSSATHFASSKPESAPIRQSASQTTDRSEEPPPSPPPAASDSAANAANGPAAEKKISCMECRLSKVKCSGGDLCTRCKRLGKECYYKSHKRGRKSDSSKIQKLERTVDSLSRALEQFSKSKVARSPSASSSKTSAVDSKRNVRAKVAEEEDPSSPDVWKSLGPIRPAGPSSSFISAMSPPAASPRAGLPAASSQRRPSQEIRQRSASVSWQTTHSIASATPTEDDPDEPENLGVHTLSNPLKLLAHASDSARDRDSGLAPSDAKNDEDAAASGDAANGKGSVSKTGNGAANNNNSEDAGVSSGAKGEAGDRQGRKHAAGDLPGSATKTVSRFGPGRGKAFFDIGLFTTKFDNLPHFDPINRGFLTLDEAESLYALFMQYINPALTLLDPHLHTFAYVRSCSALLLSSTCWIAAKYRIEASQIAADLEMHIRSTLLPTILMEGFRNAEIPQALIILSAYHPQMNTLSEDRAWAYIGFAIRIASELDMNNRITVRPANRQDDAGLARRLRNRERTWLNLWLYEVSMSQQMGRRPTLANDPVVMGCADWHLDKFALESDKSVVAVVQLRLLMLRNTDLFENFVDVSATHLPAERTGKQVELFRRICASDLDTWLATWTGPSSHHVPARDDAASQKTPSEAGSVMSAGTKARLWPNTDLPPPLFRGKRLKLYYWYTRLLLDTIALKCSHLGLEVLRPVYKDAYACCMAYLSLFVATMVPNGLFWGHNSTVVTPAYCAIFALRIVGLISTSAGAASLQVKSQPGQEAGKKGMKEEDLGIDIDAEYTFEMVEKVAKVCEEAGNATPHRRGAAGSYAFFLYTVLAKARNAWQSKLAAKRNAEENTGRKRERETDDLEGRKNKTARNGRDQNGTKNGSVAMNGSNHDEGAARNGTHAAAGRTEGIPSSLDGHDAVQTAGGAGGVGLASESDHHFLRQLMQFQAGPSGVQTAIVPSNNPSSSLHPSLSFAQSSFTDPTSSAALSGVSALNFAANNGELINPNIAVGESASSAIPPGSGVAGAAGANGAVGGTPGANGGAGVDIDWDFGMLDGFLGESLFSDMSFISSANGAPHGTTSM